MVLLRRIARIGRCCGAYKLVYTSQVHWIISGIFFYVHNNAMLFIHGVMREGKACVRGRAQNKSDLDVI